MSSARPNGEGAVRRAPRIVLSHTHDQGVAYRAAMACQNLGLDFRLLTWLYYRPERLPYSLLPLLPRPLAGPLGAKLARRRLEGLDDASVLSLDLPLVELSMRLTGNDRFAGMLHDRRVRNWLRRHAREEGWTIFHGFIGRCLLSLAAAKALGLATLLEITAPPTALRAIAEEKKREGVAPGYPLAADEGHQLAELREAEYFVAQSPFVVSELRRFGIPGERIFLAPLGVDLERFAPGGPRPAERPFRVLFVGNVGVHKGLHHLLRAWARLALPGAELFVVGQEVDAPVMAELRRTPHTRWLGRLPPRELPALYRDSDLFVCPSLSEGGPLVVLEALASGLPVVASKNASSVLRDGEEGFIVPVGDVAALAERLRRLHDDRSLRARMAASARERALGFDWRARERRIGLVYRQLLEGRAAAQGECIDLTAL